MLLDPETEASWLSPARGGHFGPMDAWLPNNALNLPPLAELVAAGEAVAERKEARREWAVQRKLSLLLETVCA